MSERIDYTVIPVNHELGKKPPRKRVKRQRTRTNRDIDVLLAKSYLDAKNDLSYSLERELLLLGGDMEEVFAKLECLVKEVNDRHGCMFIVSALVGEGNSAGNWEKDDCVIACELLPNDRKGAIVISLNMKTRRIIIWKTKWESNKWVYSRA